VDQQDAAAGAGGGPAGRGDRPGQPVAGAGDDLPPGQGGGQVDVGDGGDRAAAVGGLAAGQASGDGVRREQVHLGLASPQDAGQDAQLPGREGGGAGVADGLRLVGELLLEAALGHQPDQGQGDDPDQHRGQDGHRDKGQHQPTPQGAAQPPHQPPPAPGSPVAPPAPTPDAPDPLPRSSAL
jgi:hypothetical protein